MLVLIEKPKFEDAPSDLASIGRQVLTPEVFKILRRQEPGAGGEIQFADAINKMAASASLASTDAGLTSADRKNPDLMFNRKTKCQRKLQ